MARPGDVRQALRFLDLLAPSGIRLGLDRMRVALRALGNPEQDFPSLHVAGTNGKGSTCAFAAACLRAEGYRVGLYTSPHLHRVNERICVGAEEISDELFGRRILEVLEAYPEAADDPPPLTWFEFATLVALWHFSKEEVEVVVLETGLGGRLDATTAAHPKVTAITPISFDHMEFLGHTLPTIAGEKAGIIKPGVPVVCAQQPPEALAVIEQVAHERAAPLYLQGRDFALAQGPSGTCRYRGLHAEVFEVAPALAGAHQLQNAAVALACLELLGPAGLPTSPQSMREGLAATAWPGRLEAFEGTPSVLLDGAHNPAGAQVLREALDTLWAGRDVHLVFGVLGDKDLQPIVRALFPRARSAHLTPVQNPRSLTPERYAEDARALCSEVALYGSVDEALAGARSRAGPEDLIVGTGSLFLVGELRDRLRSSRGGAS
jgi:dihydrofolate synthase / folylpolyglutamate synthase